MKAAEFGFAEADITPSGPVQTIGFGRGDDWSRGVLSPLKAQVSVWRLGSETCCLTAIDHIGFSRENANLLRDGIGALLGAARGKVMLCFSHTHSAPNDSLEADWFREAREKILSAAGRALAAMAPFEAAWGNAAVDIGVNRRAADALLDRRAGILKVADASTGETKLILLRLTAHANALKADNYLISPDYFGAVRDLLGEKFGCAVMVTQGASGNVAPRFFQSALTPPDARDPARFVRSETALSDMAEEVFRKVVGVLDGMKPRTVERLQMYAVHEALQADVPSMERAQEIAAEALREAGIDGSGWLEEVRRLRDAGVMRQAEEAELQYFRLNDGCLAGAPNELMCEFALRASDALNCDHFYLGGYTNGCTGYFPTEEEYDLGGYEVHWSMLVYYVYFDRVAPLNRDEAARFIDLAVRHAPATLRPRAVGAQTGADGGEP
jgi:hypothetical protein